MSGFLSRWKQSLLDTAARKPSGRFGRFVYGRLAGVEKMGLLALERLDLKADDVYLELAQGGGALLSRALGTVARAAAIDHSRDMVELATQMPRRYRGPTPPSLAEPVSPPSCSSRTR